MGKTSVYDQMKEILDDYEEDVHDLADKENKRAAKDAAAELRNTSAKKTGEYAQGWKSKKLGDMDFVTYNATMPGLTHLLEKGHQIVNKKGEYGRTRGDHKIADAEEKAVNELIQRIEKSL